MITDKDFGTQHPSPFLRQKIFGPSSSKAQENFWVIFKIHPAYVCIGQKVRRHSVLFYVGQTLYRSEYAETIAAT